VLRRDGRVVAFTVTRVVADELDIVNLAVASEERRHGLGLLLIEHLIAAMLERGVRSAFLEVRAGNEAARSLYLKAGFQETQRRPKFYVDPVEDAILMRLEIDNS
jgi:[ribosomal protein S18]-alanine N-acetyltransferase